MRYFFISLFSILVSGCDPHVYEPIISNTNQNGPWLHGKKLDLDSVEDIACLVQYKMFNEQDLIFEVGFTNLCNKTVLVDPTLFSSQALSIFPNIKHPESYTMLKPAVDPE
jgi:hypothetical protein